MSAIEEEVELITGDIVTTQPLEPLAEPADQHIEEKSEKSDPAKAKLPMVTILTEPKSESVSTVTRSVSTDTRNNYNGKTRCYYHTRYGVMRLLCQQNFVKNL